MMINDELS